MQCIANDLRWLLGMILAAVLSSSATAQTKQFLPEVDAYYKLKTDVRIWFQAKETDEAGAPLTAEFGPSLDFYLKPRIRLSDITLFDLDDSKSRPLILSIGYRYLPYPSAPPTNRMEPVATINVPVPKVKFLVTDRNRADLDWQNGSFNWRYRNRVQLERTFRIRSYHISPYVSAEFYYSSQYSKWSDTALYAGTYLPIGKHVEFNPYYAHQNNTSSSPNQLYNQIGLMLNLFFSRR